MSQPSDTPLIDEALPAHASQRDVQRAALHELVSLLTESATTESEIEARHQAARDEVSKLTDRSRQEIDQRFAAQRDEGEQKYHERIAEIDAKFKADLATLESSNES